MEVPKRVHNFAMYNVCKSYIELSHSIGMIDVSVFALIIVQNITYSGLMWVDR